MVIAILDKVDFKTKIIISYNDFVMMGQYIKKTGLCAKLESFSTQEVKTDGREKKELKFQYPAT